ncbi:MAG: pyruvate, phosphate dikinase [Proteobacteria bacterium]|nr:pyruvate, phosphate dikinase [Pseudomonadota bacterium]
MEMTKYVYLFEEADGKNKQLFGGKGANLAEMTRIGLPIPPGFIITTEACLEYYANGKKLPTTLMTQVRDKIKELEKKTGKLFGDPDNPLLVSVRSGAAMSMPGMMDTILNLGINDRVVDRLTRANGNGRFAYDAYRRLIQLFGKVAMGLDDSYFDVILGEAKKKVGAKFDTDLQVQTLEEICGDFKRAIKKELGREFPQDPWTQIEIAIEAVFRSWMGKRAIDYRREFKITTDMANGTAVNVCTMVFGNMGNDSATGVAFTRDPGTGANVFFGEYLVNAQGEDVVAGIRTPKPVLHMKRQMPKQYKELEQVRHILEKHYHEVQDFEFTIERGTLYILQTRNGKMNAAARVKTSREMVRENLLTKEEALLRISPEHLEQLLHRRIDQNTRVKPLAQGLPASPGAAHGKVVFDADQAERRGMLGESVILVREETKPEDIHGFFRAKAILTSRGGKTSHAAVVARGMGKPCVVGCEAIEIDDRNKVAIVDKHHILEGDVVTIDGATGYIYLGEVPTVEPEFSPDLKTILRWADEIRTLGVRANADTPKDAAMARKLGAEGIGLCRTERMFNAADRLPIVREMILADTTQERQQAVDKLLPMQKSDFKKIFNKMQGLPVTIRLLDPPLHEFLPSVESLVWEIERLKEVKKSLEQMETIPDSFKVLLEPSLQELVPPVAHVLKELSAIREKELFDELVEKKEEILRKVRETAEVNPMLGHRGVRLGIKHPEIYKMQIQAILEAAAELIKDGVDIQPEIMVPQVCTSQELKQVHKWMDEIRGIVEKKYDICVLFRFGTMIEVVRACMRAGPLAEVTDFFSFGTNDLTQATFSFSREDAEKKFLPLYNEMQILMDNPFEILDIKGVGRLMKITIDYGKKTNPKLKVGICGEHGGNPRSIEFCHTLGLDYVSCSPYRAPVARLTAAQAKLREMARDKADLENPDYPFNVFFQDLG